MKKIKDISLSASSIIEVTTSMLILSIIFAIAAMIIVNASKSSSRLSQIKYQGKLDSICTETLGAKAYFDDEYIDGNEVAISKKILPDHPLPRLMTIELKAIDSQGHLLAGKKAMVFTQEIEKL
ncbi:hypothetical protein [Aureibacter tunicatorum]|uniref:Uncharacterized protein n=1 Tax=Aureibacter tunicatorum TaxID=866807 RepID=A0AAE3XU43_9BACT|nr:hypothetical protein [Aureibacter tunicatorum]MDR6241729.1 hypothetical protein [Aureibacter tunicatorum]BDD07409.1 hypothetical protein AUTU_48920 [Aureibacter tunicatorum]